MYCRHCGAPMNPHFIFCETCGQPVNPNVQRVVSNPVNPRPISSNPLIPRPVTSNPIAHRPITSNPVASNPFNSVNVKEPNIITSIAVDVKKFISRHIAGLAIFESILAMLLILLMAIFEIFAK